MIDPFMLLGAILLLPVIALFGFVGCAALLGLDDVEYKSTVTVNPLEATLQQGQQQRFEATASWDKNATISWDPSGQFSQQIGNAAVYTAPATIATPTSITIKATARNKDKDGNLYDVSGTATVHLVPTSPMQIPYDSTILATQGLVSYWRLQELQSAEPPIPMTDNTPFSGGVANDMKNLNNGVYKAVRVVANATTPDSPDAPGTLNLESPGLLNNPNKPSTSLQVDGGYVEVPFSNALLLSSFSLEALVFPEWSAAERKLLRTAVTFLGMTSPSGFAIYAGPNNPTSATDPDVWQVWMGDGTQFRRIPANQGSPLLVDFTKTNYLAVTYDQSTQLLNLYTYVAGIQFTDPSFNSVHDAQITYSRTANPSSHFLIGLERTTPPLYPFKGRMQEVAIYNRALSLNEIKSHIQAAL